MTEGFDFRLANPDDAEGILHVKQTVWLTEDASLDQITSALSDTDFQTFVAVENDRVAGYMACFRTIAQDGTPRWEMDELAVHPDYQRRRLGRELVKMGTHTAQNLNIPTIRALIQVDNIASQRTFSHWGYKVSGNSCGLHVCTQPLAKSINPPNDLHLVPVNTLSYRGVWLEGQFSETAFLAARVYCAEHNRPVAGALIPIDNQQASDTAANTGYEVISNYQWWILDAES